MRVPTDAMGTNTQGKEGGDGPEGEGEPATWKVEKPEGMAWLEEKGHRGTSKPGTAAGRTLLGSERALGCVRSE